MQICQWMEAMKDELRYMQDNEVWDLVRLSNGVKIVGCKWLFKIKRDSKGNVERVEAKLVSKGFTQTESIYFNETFRFILSMFAQIDLELHWMDVKTAF